MRIRVENVTAERLILTILANKEKEFLVSKELVGNKPQLSFITEEDGTSNITVVKLIPYCNEYSKIYSVTVGKNLVYGNSEWTAKPGQVVIDKKQN